MLWYRFVRRDVPQTDSEIFGVHFDSYHDHRTSYRFSTNPAGSKRDLILIGNGGGIGGLTGGDATWNPVWDVKTTRGDGIMVRGDADPLQPAALSRREDVQTWGILIERRLRPRRGDGVSHVFIPKGQPGGVPRFGHLVGIEGIRPGRKLELLPYAGGRAEYVAVPRSTNVPFAQPVPEQHRVLRVRRARHEVPDHVEPHPRRHDQHRTSGRSRWTRRSST
jgi:hypothetical protein